MDLTDCQWEGRPGKGSDKNVAINDSPMRQGTMKGANHANLTVDTEALPADVTRFRRMAERRDSLGEMSKEQAAVIGAAVKFIEIR